MVKSSKRLKKLGALWVLRKFNSFRRGSDRRWWTVKVNWRLKILGLL